MPSFHASNMPTNKAIDTDTRNASARAMRVDLSLPGAPVSMKYSAAPRQVNMSKKASAIKYVIGRIIP